MDQQWILIDEQTGLHVPWYFWLRVLDEVNRATRYGSPFALLLLEGQVETPNARPQRQLEEASAAVPPAIRSTDLGGIIAPGRVAVLLTHQDAESAEQARDRILERMAANPAPGVRWLPRLLTHPEDAAEISFMLTTGWSPSGAETAEQTLSQTA
jgi:GGDEF domain-containing protein